MAASLYERWTATLANIARAIAGRLRPAVAVEAIEAGQGFSLRWTGGREIGSVARDGTIAGRRATRLSGAAVAARLGEGHRIVDRLSLPAATRSYLGAVIGNQIDRLAPFDERDAVYGWRIADDGQPGDAETISVMVSIASRRRLIEAARPLVLAGLVPVEIAVAGGGGAPPITVALDAGGAAVERTRRRVHAAVVTLVILGLVGYLGGWWYQSRLDGELADAQATLAERGDAVRTALQNRSDSAAGNQRLAAIVGARSERDLLPVLARLSTLLPDSAYLTRMEVEDPAVRISGYADDPASLVSLLEDDPQIADVHFAAPLSRQPDQSRIGFEMEMTWQASAATAAAGTSTASPPSAGADGGTVPPPSAGDGSATAIPPPPSTPPAPTNASEGR